jgi:hypothetical protein
VDADAKYSSFLIVEVAFHKYSSYNQLSEYRLKTDDDIYSLVEKQTFRKELGYACKK